MASVISFVDMCVEIMYFAFVIMVYSTSAEELKDPCETTNFINEWKRSVAHVNDIDSQNLICDSFLQKGWYRVISGAGERMPTECPVVEISKCGTYNPIWLSRDGLNQDDKVYPADGETVDRISYSVADDNCHFKKYPIRIKNCKTYFVYYLVPIFGCYSAYCFGTELPCPEGTSSETGFTPNCGIFPEETVSPKISVSLHEEIKEDNKGRRNVHKTPKFDCAAADASEQYSYDVRYYINDVEIEAAAHINVTYEDLSEAVLVQEHWDKLFKPNMLVKCSMQVRVPGFDSPGHKTFSEQFFAGAKVPNSERGFAVKEGESLQIPIELTLPVGCIYDADDETKAKAKKNQCFVHFFNAIPKYQEDKCANGIQSESLQFLTKHCGLKISHQEWNKKQHKIEVVGECDNKINLKDRITFLRLWSDPRHAAHAIKSLSIWNNIHLPDIKIVIRDTDVASLGSSCYSHNDPHMRTFDGTTWELQNQFREPTPGEYIMYKHERLPQQVNAFFCKCNTGGKALCNCGIAIRNGESLFVANFCETIQKQQKRRVRRVNRYVASWLCDDQSLVVTEEGNKYTVRLPSGTIVEFDHGNVGYASGESFYGIHKIDIKPSQLDFQFTSGLCGKYNKNNQDDFVHRRSGLPMTDMWEFAKSWKVDMTDETLFNHNGQLPPIEYQLQEYCTCQGTGANQQIPKFVCTASSKMKTCRQKRSADTVYHGDCLSLIHRSKRDVTNNDVHDEMELDEQDKRPPMFPMVVEPDENHVWVKNPGWRNGLNENLARDKCKDAFNKSAAYSACSEFVPSVNAETYVEECVSDMKIIGDDSFLKVTLANYASSCLGDAKKMENLTATNNTQSSNSTTSESEPIQKSIFEVIEESTCPQNCSQNGICDSGVCKCFADFFGVDCSLEKTRAPVIEVDAFEGICDISKRSCKKYVIPGLDFYPENLTCKFRPFKIFQNDSHSELDESNDVFTHRGIYSSLFLMFCEEPSSRRRRAVNLVTNMATGYYLSVSNDGLNFTQEVTILVFDPRCYKCNETDLSCVKEHDCPYKVSVVPDNPDRVHVTTIGIAVGITVVVLIAAIIGIVVWKKLKQHKRKYGLTEEHISLSNPNKAVDRQDYEQ